MGLLLSKYRLLAEGMFAALLVAGLLYWHHRVFVSGMDAVKAQDAQLLAKAVAEEKQQEAALQAKADTAEHSHDQELSDLRDYRAKHPVHVWVCNNPPSGGGDVSKGSAPAGGATGAGAPSGGVQPVPAGDTGVRSGGDPRDVGSLLDALAARADRESAKVREFQSR